ncbi:Selenocysteine insertion sequence-binding protein 2-like [Chlorella vulgaris]
MGNAKCRREAPCMPPSSLASSSSAASSLTPSLSGSSCSLADCCGAAHPSRPLSSSGRSSAAVPALVLIRPSDPSMHGVEAPVPCSAVQSAGVQRLLGGHAPLDSRDAPSQASAIAAAEDGFVAAGPPPDVVLAALHASLASAQSRGPWVLQQQVAAAASPPLAAKARPPVRLGAQGGAQPCLESPAFTCRACSYICLDAEAYHQHCASLGHTMRLVQHSLVLSAPRVAAQAGAGGLTEAAAPSRGQAGRPDAFKKQGGTQPMQPSNVAIQRVPAAASTALPAAARSQLKAAPPDVNRPAGVAPPVPLPMPPVPTGVQLTSCINQVVDPQLDALCHTLLKLLRQHDHMERRAAARWEAAGFAAPPRRLVGGLREVRKAVLSGTAVAVVVAVDIQETSLRAGQPGAEVAETCQLAEARGIPVVFALSRVGLGSIFGASKRMSAVALVNVSGLEQHLAALLHLAGMARYQFTLMHGAL